MNTGDATLIISPDKHGVLIDAGNIGRGRNPILEFMNRAMSGRRRTSANPRRRIEKGRMMDRIEKSREIGRKIADAFVAGAMADENLFAPDATTWHNTDEIEIPHSASRAAWTIVRGLAPDFHAEDIRVHGFGDGFAIQYVFLGTLADGSRIRIPGCIIGTIRDGKIARMQEYVDSAHATKLAAAIQEAPTK